jgi:hypothetical protein
MPINEIDRSSVGQADGFAREGVMLFGLFCALVISTLICVILG